MILTHTVVCRSTSSRTMSVVCRSTSSRTMSVGASPRTGTLNSRDVPPSQWTNMSGGSQIINSSPPLVPLSSLALHPQQQHQAAVRLSPSQHPSRELSPMSLSVMSSSPTVPVVTVSAVSSDMHNDHTSSPVTTDVHSHRTPSPATRPAAVAGLLHCMLQQFYLSVHHITFTICVMAEFVVFQNVDH